VPKLIHIVLLAINIKLLPINIIQNTLVYNDTHINIAPKVIATHYTKITIEGPILSHITPEYIAKYIKNNKETEYIIL